MTVTATAIPSMLTRCVHFRTGQGRDRSKLGCLIGFGGAYLSTNNSTVQSTLLHFLLPQHQFAVCCISKTPTTPVQDLLSYVFHIICTHPLFGIIQFDRFPSTSIPMLACLRRNTVQVGACSIKSIKRTGTQSDLGTSISVSDYTTRDLEYRRFW